MNTRSCLRVGAVALFALGALARPVSAQITTGTVSGTIKDPQGGVLPGAHHLVRCKGNPSPTEVTSETGDSCYPDHPAYNNRNRGPLVKTLKRSGVAVSPGSRVTLGTLVLELGGTTEVVTVKGETPVIQSSTGERSFTVSPEEVENLPLADRNFATLASLAPGVDGTSRIGGGGATNFMMDGIGTMDTGSNRLLVAVNVASIAEVKY